VRGQTKSRVAMSFLANPSPTSRTTSRSVGVSEAPPLVGRLRSPRPALCVGDRLLGSHVLGVQQGCSFIAARDGGA
jgi:hypothetical protein